VLERLFRILPKGLRSLLEVRAAPAADEDFWYTAISAMRKSAAGITVDAESAMQCSVFRASVQGIADDLSTIPFPVLRQGGSVPEKAKDHPVYDILNVEMNPELSATDGRSLWQTHKYQYGEAFSFIERANGTIGPVKALHPLHPNEMQADRNRISGQLFYRYTPPNKPVKILYPKDVIHIKDLSDDGVTGRKLTEDGKDSIALAIAAERFAGYFFGNGANIGNVIEADGNLDDPMFERMVAQLKKRSGLEGAHRALVLEGGAKLKQSMIDPRQAQTMELARFAGEQVMRLFRVQPTMVQDNERATFSNAGMQTQNHVKYTLMPPAERVEAELDRKLFTPVERATGLSVKHNFNGILRGDVEARGIWYKVMITAGLMTRNEVRLLEDLEPVAGGDVVWVPVNSMPITGPLANQKQEPTDADPGNDGGDNEPVE